MKFVKDLLTHKELQIDYGSMDIVYGTLTCKPRNGKKMR